MNEPPANGTDALDESKEAILWRLELVSEAIPRVLRRHPDLIDSIAASRQLELSERIGDRAALRAEA